MKRASVKIPGNSRVRQLLFIESDVTKEFLIEELRRVKSHQAGSMKGAPSYVSYVRRLQRAIDARR